VVGNGTYSWGDSYSLDFWQADTGDGEISNDYAGISDASLYLGPTGVTKNHPGASYGIQIIPSSASVTTTAGLALRQNSNNAYLDSVGSIVIGANNDGATGDGELFHINSGSTPTTRFTVNDDGSIDLATAGTYLNWGATIGTTGYGFRDSAGTIQWKNSGGSWQAVGNTSDMRVKRDIVDLPENDGLAAIMKLRPVSFRWKDVEQDNTQGKQIGLIAQEVEKIYPDSGLTFNFGDTTMVLPGGKKETVKRARGMNYEKLVAPLIKAVQQQQGEIKDLQSGIDELKAAEH
jgi:hypothetical protein